jgi:hypothetical protein
MMTIREGVVALSVATDKNHETHCFENHLPRYQIFSSEIQILKLSVVA